MELTGQQHRKIVFQKIGTMTVNEVFNRLIRDPEFNSEDFGAFQKLVNRMVDKDLEKSIKVDIPFLVKLVRERGSNE